WGKKSTSRTTTRFKGTLFSKVEPLVDWSTGAMESNGVMYPKSNTPTLQYTNTSLRSSERRVFLWSISSLVALAWLILWLWDRSPYGRYLNHGHLAEIGGDGGTGSAFLSAALYLVGWTLMTVAMMLPTTLPLLDIFRRLTARRPERGQLMLLVITGYLSVWIGFGVGAHLADWVLHLVVEYSPWVEAN